MSLTKAQRAQYKKVDKKFLLDLAKTIYDPSTRQYLRLCNGTLQNGPDPENSERPMHCGLGELYFAMTGRQPRETRTNEEKVVHLAFELSTLNGFKERQEKEVKQKVAGLNLPSDLTEHLLSEVTDHFSQMGEEAEDEFVEILNGIPEDNDEGPCTEECKPKDFRDRSKRVAQALREAASLLPE